MSKTKDFFETKKRRKMGVTMGRRKRKHGKTQEKDENTAHDRGVFSDFFVL